jgi:hypothetical protein
MSEENRSMCGMDMAKEKVITDAHQLYKPKRKVPPKGMHMRLKIRKLLGSFPEVAKRGDRH